MVVGYYFSLYMNLYPFNMNLYPFKIFLEFNIQRESEGRVCLGVMHSVKLLKYN